jgi:superfamily I DNA/RNA helicase
LTYTAAQRLLITSKPENKKIAGVAGSGKTYVLAKRAVNAYLRTRRPVLILTFNITLRNYIHDRVSEVRESFDWKYFLITNYHCFFAAQATRYELPVSFDNIDDNSSFEDESFFASVSNNIERFGAIFIDEVQDYKVEWLRIIKKYFLRGDGEFVLFGDEKQNLYGRPLDDKAIRTNIPGPFTRLRQSHRLNSRVADLATRFQAEFLCSRHAIDSVYSIRQPGLFEPHVEYIDCEGFADERVAEIIFKDVERWDVHPNDVAILCSRNEQVRRLDAIVRRNWRQRTTICSETQEEFEALANRPSKKSIKASTAAIRRSRRYNFWANAGTVKLSTVHSFKGRECSTVFVVIEKPYFDEW